jgi:hypothetical protein
MDCAKVRTAQVALSRVDYLLAELRCASLRVRLLAAEIDNIGVALKAGEMDEDLALAIMIQEGLVVWCSPRLEGALKQFEAEREKQRWEVNDATSAVDH